MSEPEAARARAWQQLQRARADFKRGRLEEYALQRAESRYARLYQGSSAGAERRQRGGTK